MTIGLRFRPGPTKTDKHYVNNAILNPILEEYLKKIKKAKKDNVAREKLPKIPDEVGRAISQICNRLSFRKNFISYSYKDEMVSDALENCISAIENFNPEKSKNPFAYFTQIAFQAFVRRIQKEERQSYIKHKNFQNSYVMQEINDYVDGDDDKNLKQTQNSNVDEFITNFERKISRSRKKRGKKGLLQLVD